MKTLLRSPLFYLTVVLTIFVSWTGIGFVTAQQWHGPTQPFPNQSEIGEPLSTGSKPQTKSGTLTLNAGSSNAALRIEGGSTICLPSEVGGSTVCKQAWSQIGSVGAASRWNSSGGNAIYYIGRVGIGRSIPEAMLHVSGGDIKASSEAVSQTRTEYYYTLISEFELSQSSKLPFLSCDKSTTVRECDSPDYIPDNGSAISPKYAYDRFYAQKYTSCTPGDFALPPTGTGIPQCQYYAKYELKSRTVTEAAQLSGGNIIAGNSVQAREFKIESGDAVGKKSFINLSEDVYYDWVKGETTDTCDGNKLGIYTCDVQVEKSCVDVAQNPPGISIVGGGKARRNVQCIANYVFSRY